MQDPDPSEHAWNCDTNRINDVMLLKIDCRKEEEGTEAFSAVILFTANPAHGCYHPSQGDGDLLNWIKLNLIHLTSIRFI